MDRNTIENRVKTTEAIKKKKKVRSKTYLNTLSMTNIFGSGLGNSNPIH